MNLVKVCLMIHLLSFTMCSYIGQGTIFGQYDSEISHCGLHRSLYETPFHVAFNIYNNDYSNDNPPHEENRGFFQNGANCGRWIKLTLGKHCVGTNIKFCDGTEVADIWAGESINVIGYDSCADQGICRTDPNHLDISSLTIEEIGGQVLVQKWNYQTYCQNNPGFVIQPEDAEKIEGLTFKQKLLSGTLCQDPTNFKKTKEELKNLGSVLKSKWNTRLISWDFIESPNYSGDIIIYSSPYGNKWGQLTLFSHLKNGITRVQRLFDETEWRDGERCGLSGLCYFFQVDSGQQQTTIRIYDANGNLYPNQYSYIYDPNGTYRSLTYATELISQQAEQTTQTNNQQSQTTTYIKTTLPTVNFQDISGFYTEMTTYLKKDWLACGVPASLLDTTYFASLARQNGKGTATQDLPFPISDDLVGAYNNGKNCGRWIKVTLGRQCESTNWGDGCENYVDDPFTGKQFYALVVDLCWLGEIFCGKNPNAIQVSESAVKQVGESIMMDWNNREVKWSFVKDPNSTPIKIFFGSGTNPWWLQLLILHEPNGISKVQRKVSNQWLDAQRSDDQGGVWILPGRGSTRIFQIRAYDIDGVQFDNEYIFKFPCPMDTEKGFQACSQELEALDVQTVTQGYQIPTFNIDAVSGFYTHLAYYDQRDWLHCGIPGKILGTKNIVSLARQNTKGTTEQNLDYPISEDKVGSYNNGKNCERWVKVTLGNQCEQKNWGDGCNEQFQDEYSGKSFYAVVVDACWAGDAFCKDDPNALQVSADALKQVGDGVLSQWNNREVKWEFVDNPNNNPIRFYFAGGSNKWWLPFYAVDMKRGLSNIQRYVNGVWVNAERSGDQGGSWVLPGGGMVDNFNIKLFDVNGQAYPGTYSFKFPCPLNANNEQECKDATQVTLI